MEREYGERYRDLYDYHWWWRAREALILETLERIAPEPGFGRILDIGCGDALFFDPLSRFGTPEGIETEANLVTERGRARGPIYVGSLESYQASHRFGLITMLDVVEHVENDVAFLRTAVSLLEPGGRIVITVPAFESLWTKHDDMNRHHRRYTKGTISQLAVEAGLILEDFRYFFVWLSLPKFALHLVSKVRQVETPPVPGIPTAPINRFLIAVSRAEQRLFGGHAPFGSSLLVVGRVEKR